MDYLLIVVTGIAALLLGYLMATLKTRNKILDAGKVDLLKEELQTLRAKIESSTIEYQEELKTSAKWKEKYLQLCKRNEELEDLQTRFSKDFELLAERILEEKNEKNNVRLNEILTPFNEKIKDFKKSIEENYLNNTKDRTALIEQIKMLSSLNEAMRKDAQRLTNALQQDNKSQGNWGEMILEKILEQSGLRKGMEYESQYSTTDEHGKRIQPDIVVNLPDNKHVIIDSKVSLKAYNELINSEDENSRNQALADHLLSIRTHIKLLSEKNYQHAEGLESPDFVLMFLPIEASFSIATQEDQNLFEFAWNRNIVVVSPTTLLATLRTISSIWKQEHQNKNVLEIAKKAGAMYDKFVGFLEDVQKIEKGIEGLQTNYTSAIKKLSTGKGNLIHSAEKIKALGAKTKKNVPERFLPNHQTLPKH